MSKNNEGAEKPWVCPIVYPTALSPLSASRLSLAPCDIGVSFEINEPSVEELKRTEFRDGDRASLSSCLS
nr:hypothetical protein BgiMline_006260 [Biomphalaria glabrata]